MNVSLTYGKRTLRRRKSRATLMDASISEVGNPLSPCLATSPNKALLPPSCNDVRDNRDTVTAMRDLESRIRCLELEKEILTAPTDLARLRHSISGVSVHPKDMPASPEQPIASSVVPVVSDDYVSSSRERGRQVTGLELPKVELIHFDGDPVNYLKFIRQFDYFVESRTADAGQRLLYLLYYCKGRARDAIEGCIILPPAEAYCRARSILEKLFGQTFLVCRAQLDSLLIDVNSLKGTKDQLSRLALKMQNVSICLSQLNRRADLDSIFVLNWPLKRNLVYLRVLPPTFEYCIAR